LDIFKLVIGQLIAELEYKRQDDWFFGQKAASLIEKETFHDAVSHEVSVVKTRESA